MSMTTCARKTILRICDKIQLSTGQHYWFWVGAMPRMKPLSQNNFQEKELSHRCSTSADFLLLQLLLSIKNLTSGQDCELKAIKPLCLCFDPEIFCVWIHYNAWSNLMQEIQFLEIMGGSNLTQIICILFEYVYFPGLSWPRVAVTEWFIFMF